MSRLTVGQEEAPHADASPLPLHAFLAAHSDSVLPGHLLACRPHVADQGAVLSQCIRRLSAMRIHGTPLPAYILIADLGASTLWVYRAARYLEAIERVYYSGAPRLDRHISGSAPDRTIGFDRPEGIREAQQLLREVQFTRIHIDENCIVGWARTFYQAMPNAAKEDLLGDDTGRVIGEIRRPVCLAPYIYPYTGETNVRFSYLMDKLNATMQKKSLGAFYTPPAYAAQAALLVRAAIARVPQGNDYVILARCAGSGNLASWLTEEELSHCIVSTIEYYEYKVLLELLGEKVRYIVPPTAAPGVAMGADALTQRFIEDPVIRHYVEDPRCTMILYENPPYTEANGTTKTDGAWRKSFAAAAMKQQVGRQATNELANVFIWSAFRYYLRQPTDSYIVFSPVKYWKVHHLAEKRFLGGYAFDRRGFHTNIAACIMCAYWSNEDAAEEEICLTGYGYDAAADTLIASGDVPVRKIHAPLSRLYDTRAFPDDVPGIACGLSGAEAVGRRCYGKRIYNANIVGYLCANGAGFDHPDLNSGLTVAGRYDGHGCFLRKDSYLMRLPLFCASRYISYHREWTARARIMKSGDGAERYLRDAAAGRLDRWFRRCLLFTCLDMQDHMRSFMGSDGRFYRNELCLDDTSVETLALR